MVLRIEARVLKGHGGWHDGLRAPLPPKIGLGRGQRQVWTQDPGELGWGVDQEHVEMEERKPGESPHLFMRVKWSIGPPANPSF